MIPSNIDTMIDELCELRTRNANYASNHAAYLFEPGRKYCVFPKGAKLWGE